MFSVKLLAIYAHTHDGLTAVRLFFYILNLFGLLLLINNGDIKRWNGQLNDVYSYVALIK